MLDCRCGNQRVGNTGAELAHDPASTFRDRAINIDLTKRTQQPCHQVTRRAPGEELGPGDHRVVQPMLEWSQRDRPTKVIDEYVGIDE